MRKEITSRKKTLRKKGSNGEENQARRDFSRTTADEIEVRRRKNIAGQSSKGYTDGKGGGTTFLGELRATIRPE